MSELNPDQPVTAAMHDRWHVVVGLLVSRFPGLKTVITLDEIKALSDLFPGDMPTVLVHERPDGVHLQMISETDARQIAERERQGRSKDQ